MKSTAKYKMVFEAMKDHVAENYPKSKATLTISANCSVIRLDRDASCPNAMKSGAVILGRTRREADPESIDGIRRFKEMPSAKHLDEDMLAEACIDFVDTLLYSERNALNAVNRCHRRRRRLDPVPNVGHYVALDDSFGP